MPQVSIIVTSYNIAPYIGACLDSILAQSLTDLEIIVVDDGSTDDSPKIIQDYADRDARIRPVLLQQNTIGGVASAANAGLDIASGDYIGFADGDDLYEPQMFERLYAAAHEADADLSLCKYVLLDDASGQTTPPAERQMWFDVDGLQTLDLDEATRKHVLKFIAVPWRKLYRRSLIEQNQMRFPVGDYFFEDNPFHWFAVLSADKVVLVPEVLCQHRMARQGQTMQSAGSSLFKMFDHHETIRDWLVQRGLFDTYKLELLSWVSSQLEWISRRADASAIPELYERLRPIVAHYTPQDLTRMHEVARKGRRAQMMLTHLQEGDAEGFGLAAGLPPPRHTLVGSGLAHLRERGPRATAVLTARYLKDRLGIGRALAKLPALPGRAKNAERDELAFSVLVLQRQIERLEQRIDRIEGVQTRASDE